MIKYVLFGQRNSGTSYIRNLLLNNFTNITEFGNVWKHGLVKNELIPSDNDDIVFFLVVRNPYEWIKSFYHNPSDAKPIYKKEKGTIHDFIQKSIKLKASIMTIDDNNNHVRQPIVEEYKNIIEMRNNKIKSFLTLQNIAKKLQIINYEEARDNPKKIINNIANKYGFKLKSNFVPIMYYKKNTEMLYEPKKYDKLSESDIKFINSKLNWENENRVGYQRICKSDKLPNQHK